MCHKINNFSFCVRIIIENKLFLGQNSSNLITWLVRCMDLKYALVLKNQSRYYMKLHYKSYLKECVNLQWLVSVGSIKFIGFGKPVNSSWKQFSDRTYSSLFAKKHSSNIHIYLHRWYIYAQWEARKWLNFLPHKNLYLFQDGKKSCMWQQ